MNENEIKQSVVEAVVDEIERSIKPGYLRSALLERIKEKIGKLPILQDAVQVVRCKDCTEWQTDWTPSRGVQNSHYCAVMDGATKPMDYCSYGERR